MGNKPALIDEIIDRLRESMNEELYVVGPEGYESIEGKDYVINTIRAKLEEVL